MLHPNLGWLVQHCCCCSHMNSHNQVRGHRTGSSHSGAEEYPREKHTHNPRWYTHISQLTQFMPPPETYKKLNRESVCCCCFLTLTLVKNLESVVTQRCWSPGNIRKTKWNQNSSGKYYAFPPKIARYGKRRTSEKVQCANWTHMAAGIHSTTA